MDREVDIAWAGNQKGDRSVISLQRGKCLLWKMCIKEEHRVQKPRGGGPGSKIVCRGLRKEHLASGCRDPTASLLFSNSPTWSLALVD